MIVLIPLDNVIPAVIVSGISILSSSEIKFPAIRALLLLASKFKSKISVLSSSYSILLTCLSLSISLEELEEMKREVEEILSSE